MTAIAIGLDQSLRFTCALNREMASAGRGASSRFEVRLPFCFSCSQLVATFAAFIPSLSSSLASEGSKVTVTYGIMPTRLGPDASQLESRIQASGLTIVVNAHRRRKRLMRRFGTDGNAQHEVVSAAAASNRARRTEQEVLIRALRDAAALRDSEEKQQVMSTNCIDFCSTYQRH